MTKPTRRKQILESMEQKGDTWADVIRCTLTPAQLDVEFDSGWGGENGEPFTLWTKKRVYFPACYDGSEWVASAPRKPCDEIMQGVGGG